MKPLRSLLIFFVSFAFIGCGPKIQPRTRGYFGPTESLYEVARQINANNEKLSTLWMRHHFSADIVEESKKSTRMSGGGVIMYRSPDSMIMTGSESIIGKIFEIGCNDSEYWMGVPFEKVDTIWYGQMRHLGKPCVRPIPIQPDLLLEVLGVFAIDMNFSRYPAPVMRFNNDQDAYMLTWVQPQTDRLLAIKEVWYDRQTKRPRLVSLFDEHGRILLRAYLSEHQTVEIPDVPKEQWPAVAGKFNLLFTESGTRMAIAIEDAYQSYKGAPGERAFMLPNVERYSHQIELDQSCDD